MALVASSLPIAFCGQTSKADSAAANSLSVLGCLPKKTCDSSSLRSKRGFSVSGPASSRQRRQGKQELSIYQGPGTFASKRRSLVAIDFLGGGIGRFSL